jgi:uncharacterized damage-inducible protein DinB
VAPDPSKAEGSRPEALALSPVELAALLDRILAATERMIASVPDRMLDYSSSSDGRSVGDLAYHLFRLSVALVDAMDRGRFAAEWLRETRPADLEDGRAIARYGALVRGRLGGWFEGAGPAELARVIEGYDGPQRGNELLESTTRHAARHLRQLHAMLEGIGLPPEALPVADLARLAPPVGGA